MLTESDERTIERLAQRWNVSPDIHPDDFIFRFIYQHQGFSKKDAALQYYFDDGHRSAQQLAKLLSEVCRYDPDQKLAILEFASGYGCVTRHLRNVLPAAEIVSCDIHEAAVGFIRDRLAAKAILSKSVPERFVIDERPEVVFALSFFSHMPKTTFRRWLTQLSSLLKPGGHLIFTTHGRESAKSRPNVRFDREGFWFKPSSEQKDLDGAEYGLAFTRSDYVFSQLRADPANRLIYYQEAYWWKHQDVFVVRRDGDSTKTLTKENGGLRAILGSAMKRFGL